MLLAKLQQAYLKVMGGRSPRTLAFSLRGTSAKRFFIDTYPGELVQAD
jgi:hypothetical protein